MQFTELQFAHTLADSHTHAQCNTSGILQSHSSPLTAQCVPYFFPNSWPDVSGSTRSVYPGRTEQVFAVHFSLPSAVYLLYQELTDRCCRTPADASLFLFTHQCCNHSPKRKQVKLHTRKNTFSVHHIQTGGDQFFTMPQRNYLKYDLSLPPLPAPPPSSPQTPVPATSPLPLMAAPTEHRCH